MSDSQIKIIVEPSALEFWKPQMSISDFYLQDNHKRFTLNRIVYQKIVNNSKKASVDIEYYDARSNNLLTKTVNFQFKNSKRDAIDTLLQENKFVFNSTKLNSLNFISFTKKDIEIHDPNVLIENFVIKNWTIFGKKITFQIETLVYKKIKKTILITKKLDVDSKLLIRKFLTSDPSKSFLKMNSYIEFEILQFAPVVKNYHLAFGKEDEKKLFKIVNDIEIINPKILSLHIDVFNENALAYFSSAVLIDNHYFKNFIFESRYDATYLQKLIKTRLKELPLRSTIQGRPRTIGVQLKDVFDNYKRAYLKTILAKNGMDNLFERNIIIKVTNYNLETNKADVGIHFKPFLKNNEPFIKKQLPFEKTLSQFASYDYQENNFIMLKNQGLIDKHPIYKPKVSDFAVSQNDFIKIVDVDVANDVPLQSRWAKYKFKLIANDPESKINFDYEQPIYFATSRLEYLFQNLKINNLNISYLSTRSDQYYHNVSLNFDQKWVPIYDPKILSKIVFEKDFSETDFEITKIQFDKTSIFKTKMPIKITITSEMLKNSQVVNGSIELLTKNLLYEFERLSGNDIKLFNPAIIASYPFPILDIGDFYTKKSFEILEMTSRYNENNSSVTCTFVVALGAKQRVIENTFYFVNDALNRAPKQMQAKELKLFNSLSKDDIELDYDENNLKYFINPEVKVKVKNPAFYAESQRWSLKSWWRKIVSLDIEVKYCTKSKFITKTIRFKNRISWKEYKAWKDASYALN